MAKTQTNFDLSSLERNEATRVSLRGKVYSIRAMKNAVSEKMDRYIAKANLSYSEDKSKLLVNMSENRKLVPKCLSLMLLGTFLRVKLFHFFYWRYLHIKCSQEEMAPVLNECFEVNNVGFFFQNLASLQGNCQLIERMTMENTISISAKQRLALETQSLSNSTDKSPLTPSSDIGG